MNKKTPLARNLRELRKSRSWTQEQLGGAARLDVRTVQRAETGKSVSAETLQALAGALDVDLDLLTADWEQVRRNLENFRKQYKQIPLQVLERASDLEQMLGSALAYQFHKQELFTDDQEDAIAGFQQDLVDCGDLWGDVGPIGRRDLVKCLHGGLEQLFSKEVSVSAGRETVMLQAHGSTEADPWPILYVAFSSKDHPLRIALRERGASFSFA